jgi:hypothetical protein
MQKVARIFFAHSIFREDETLYSQNLIESLSFNFKKIRPLIDELKALDYDVKFICGRGTT